jgi:spore coat protein CotH
MDHIDPDEKGFRTGRGLHFLYVQPKEREISREQSVWLIDYLNQFERTLHGRAFADPNEGYAKFLDVDAFIDHYWLVELSKNVDGFRFSTYLQLKEGGKLRMGPIWDWDQSFGNANFYGGDSPEGFYWPYIRQTEIDWFARLSQDPQFQRRCLERWTELRRDAFDTTRIFDRIDALVASLGEAGRRNSNRWPTRRDYSEYIEQMKGWIRQRGEWIDRQNGAASAHATR